MNFRYLFIYRLGLVLLLVIAFWAIWANGQPAVQVLTTDKVSIASTNEFQVPTFGLDSVDWLSEHKAMGEPLWKYAASLIYLVLAIFTAWVVDFIVGGWLQRLATRTKLPYGDVLLKLLRGPLKVVACVILLNIGLGLFDWPARAQLMFSRGLILVVAWSVTYVAIKMVEILLGLWRERVVSVPDRVFAEQLFPLMSKVSKVGIVIAAVALTADNLGIKITSLLAGLSVGGLALGLAAQDTVANLFGAVSIFLDKPFYIGDYIKVESVEGSVVSIGLRSTRILNPFGHRVTIPNKLMGNAIITNVRPVIRTEMNFGLTCDTPVEKVKRATAILQEIFRSNPKTSDLVVSFNKFTNSAPNLYVAHVWAGSDDKEYFAQMQEWNLQIKHRFETEKIELAFPTQTVHLKTEGKAMPPTMPG